MHRQSQVSDTQTLYRHFDQGLGSWISFRPLSLEDDLDRFHRWQNTDRVARFWDERGTLEEHRAYLAKLLATPHSRPVIGCCDGDPFLYLEIYWARRDRLADHYEADDHDRGIHMLVGEERHRGPHKVRAWLSALCRFLFEEAALTRRIVSEPRADNLKMIGYLREQRFEKVKEFDFPHKTAALMVLTRDAFFTGHDA